MPTIASLAVAISANAEGFTRGVDKAYARHKQFIRDLQKDSVDVGQIRADVGGAGGLVQVQRDMRAMRNARNEMMKGTDIDSGAVKELSKFDTAAIAEGSQKAAITLGGVAKTAGAVAAAINAVDIATDVWNGDITVAADKVKQLPLGIGQVARALESVLGKWTGITDEIDRNKAMAEAMTKTYEAQAAVLSRVKEYAAAAAAAREGETRRFVLGGMQGFERQRAEAEAGLQDRLKAEEDRKKAALADIDKKIVEAQAEARKLGDQGQGYGAIPILKSIEQMERSKQKITKESETTMTSFREAARLETIRINAAEAKDKVAKEREKAAQVAALDSELAQQRARSAGDSLAAEIEAIRFASQKRADAAREAGNFDAAAKEAELGELAIADARRKAEEQSANELDRVNGEIARRRLDRLGNSLDAELLQIEQSYKERIAAAQAAGKLELASRLEALKQEEMAAARAKGVDKGSAAEVVLRYTAFTGKTGTRAGRSVEETELPKQTAALQSIDTRLAKGVPAVAA